MMFPKNIGFTGTRNGMTPHQREELFILLRQAKTFHHGDCVGADAEAHAVARARRPVRIIVHPPSDPKLRAYCDGDELYEPKPYLDRNKDIVDETDLLIAAPEGPETHRSGTWSTVRYARRQGKPVIVLES